MKRGLWPEHAPQTGSTQGCAKQMSSFCKATRHENLNRNVPCILFSSFYIKASKKVNKQKQLSGAHHTAQQRQSTSKQRAISMSQFMHCSTQNVLFKTKLEGKSQGKDDIKHLKSHFILSLQINVFTKVIISIYLKRWVQVFGDSRPHLVCIPKLLTAVRQQKLASLQLSPRQRSLLTLSHKRSTSHDHPHSN